MAWSTVQIYFVDAPANIAYSGLYGMLAFVWSELRKDAVGLAKFIEVEAAHEEHTPNIVPHDDHDDHDDHEFTPQQFEDEFDFNPTEPDDDFDPVEESEPFDNGATDGVADDSDFGGL